MSFFGLATTLEREPFGLPSSLAFSAALASLRSCLSFAAASLVASQARFSSSKRWRFASRAARASAFFSARYASRLMAYACASCSAMSSYFFLPEALRAFHALPRMAACSRNVTAYGVAAFGRKCFSRYS